MITAVELANIIMWTSETIVKYIIGFMTLA